jgi:putative adhesin
MKANPQEGAAVSTFWDSWRKEIIRGATLFCAVLAIGFVAHAAHRMAHQHIKDLPVALRDLRSEFARDADGGPRATGQTWTYRARLAPKQWVWIRNTRGSVTVEPATGDSLQVSAVKTYRSSDTASVRLVAAPYDGGLAVCAIWGDEAGCGPGQGDIKLRGARHNDVAVDFTVRLPRNVGLGATTMVGDVHVAGARGPLMVHAMSGDVDVATTKGPVKVELVNGDVRVRMEAFGDTGAVSVTTINGSVSAELPSQLDADVEATTVNGSITTDYPLTVNGKFTGRNVKGTLGRGGRAVHLKTVNGSIKLKKAI